MSIFGVTGFFPYSEIETAYFSRADAQLGKAVLRLGKIERPVFADGFVCAAYMITAQLISTRAAQQIWLRITTEIPKMLPKQIMEKSTDDLMALGLSRAKSNTLLRLAQAVLDGTLNFVALRSCSDRQIEQTLTKIKGIGSWTARMLLLHHFQRPDVLSYHDAALRRGLCKLKGLESVTKLEFERLTAPYQPYGSVASIYLWALSAE